MLLEHSFTLFCNRCGIGAGNLLHHTHTRRLVVVAHRHAVLQSAELYLGNVLELQGLSGLRACDDDIAKLLSRFQPTGVAHTVFVSHVALLSERTRCRLDVLLSQSSAYVGRHQPVLLHHIGLQPYTHGVCFQTWAHHVAHTFDTLQGRNDVDVGIVGEELVVVLSVLGGQRVHDNLRSLSLHHCHADARYLGRQQCQSLRHAVLHVHRTHIGVGALTEVYLYLCRT